MTTTQDTTNIDSRTFRNVMGLFATGVTVITTQINGETHGMTANALTSVSLDPLLVLVCVQKNAHMAEFLQTAGEFAINILNEGQADLSNYFAGIWADDKPAPDFDLVPWVGGPRLQGAIGAIACKIDEFIEGGDHWIVMGAVIDLYQPETADKPLLYYKGRYRKIRGD